MTTKSARIMALHKEGRSTREIVHAIYGQSAVNYRTRCAYVRVVVNQRKGTGQSAHDIAYIDRKAASNPDWVAVRRARWAAHGEIWAKTPQGRAYRRDYMRQKRLAQAAANQIG